MPHTHTHTQGTVWCGIPVRTVIEQNKNILHFTNYCVLKKNERIGTKILIDDHVDHIKSNKNLKIGTAGYALGQTNYHRNSEHLLQLFRQKTHGKKKKKTSVLGHIVYF